MVRGYKDRARALVLAQRVSATPRLWRLEDNTFVAVGDTLLLADGTRDALVYGARGTTALASELWAREEAW